MGTWCGALGVGWGDGLVWVDCARGLGGARSQRTEMPLPHLLGPPPPALPTPILALDPSPHHPGSAGLACPWLVQPEGHLPRHVAECPSLPQVSAETLFGNVTSLIRAHRSFWEEVLGPTLEETRASGQPLDPVSLQDGFLTVRRGQGPLPDGVELGGPRGVLFAGQALVAEILV